ncbi:MAG: MBL fold metallo-hydrolase [Candidatus Symbiothrix sp.]|jgi:phosphoribosyl 1,2-cyclic phosphodiesterase|nr:MBL fold metallo-hydrolase [Candidatus Symbiothrix sp.]
MELKFLSLGSGSSGNCYYLGTDDYGILLDAGLSTRSIKKILKDNGIGLEKIMAVFITHDHADHIKSVGSLGEKYGIPIYATAKVHDGIDHSIYADIKLSVSRRIIEKEVAVYIKDLKITAFEVPHDASDCVGYLVDYKHHKWVLATDVGHIDAKVGDYIGLANHLVIEANYDQEMLSRGSYPPFLKKRISNGYGHLCNSETAEFLAANFDLHLKNIWLCHLSKDNNHPDLAYKTVEMAMGQYGIRIGKDVNLVALKRTTPSELYVL